MKKIIFCSILILSFVGCGGGLAIKEKVIYNYYLIATYDSEGCSLSYNDDGSNYSNIIDATVFSVGYNDKYIVAKQHPRTFPNKANRSVTQYYIVQIQKNNTLSMENVIGPLTVGEFNERCKELKIENIRFTKVLKDLE